MQRELVKRKSKDLRVKGYSYSEISEALSIPRPTIATWCKDVTLSVQGRKRLQSRIDSMRKVARAGAVRRHHELRQMRKNGAAERVAKSHTALKDPLSRMLILGALYLAEGTKGDRGALTFCNSDPQIIYLFLTLLRESCSIDESRFRCTVQGRVGQDFERLERFWSHWTHIPHSQFYASRSDMRSSGQKLRKLDYKGVCRIDYLSADVLYEMQAIGRMLTTGP